MEDKITIKADMALKDIFAGLSHLLANCKICEIVHREAMQFIDHQIFENLQGVIEGHRRTKHLVHHYLSVNRGYMTFCMVFSCCTVENPSA